MSSPGHHRRRNQALLTWYERSRRPLPWRDTSDPWKILVSEVMAQQTQLSRVEPAYRRFLDRFPSPTELARAELAEVIAIWRDLGYQRRAVNLWRAAHIIDADGWPAVDELERLPGVGPYTASALACFAFGRPVPTPDVNLRRVLSRWVGEVLSGSRLDTVATEHLDRQHPGEWNQAVMDLGASLCRPRSPRCDLCPVESWCADPSIELNLHRQTQYDGSVRQARAAILKLLASRGAVPEKRLPADVKLEPNTVADALSALKSEGMIQVSDHQVQLADHARLRAT